MMRINNDEFAKERKRGLLGILLLIGALTIGTIIFLAYRNNDITPKEQEKDIIQITSETAIDPETEIGEIISLEYQILLDNTNSVFEGVVGNEEIRMMIHRNGEKLKIYYLFKENHSEQFLEGTYDTNNGMFEAWNEDRSIIFQMREEANTSKGDMLSGRCQLGKEVGEENVTVTLVYMLGEASDRNYLYEYWEYDTICIESFVETLQQHLRDSDKHSIAKNISYPIKVNLNGKKELLHKEEEFLAIYDEIFTQKFKDRIVNDYTKFMYANYMGILLDNGSIWISLKSAEKDYKIIAINN